MSLFNPGLLAISKFTYNLSMESFKYKLYENGGSIRCITKLKGEVLDCEFVERFIKKNENVSKTKC